jgi:hypothetical protein
MSLILSERSEAEQINREIAEQVDEQIAVADHWNTELRKIDPGLSLVLGRDDAEGFEVRASHWAIKKRVPGSVDEYIVLQGPEGQYREPGAWMLEMLQGADMWNDRRRHEREEIKRRIQVSKERAYETERQQRLDEAELAVRAAKRLRGPEGFEKRTDLKGHASRSSQPRKYALEKP